MSFSSRTYGHLAMVAQTLLIAPGYTFANYAATQFHPIVLLSIRSFFASLLFLPILAPVFKNKNLLHNVKQHFSFILLTSIFGTFLNQLFFIIGISLTTPAHSALLYSLTPLGVLLISSLIIRLEPFNWKKFFLVLLAIVGALFIIMDKKQSEARNPLLGNIITFFGLIWWCLYLSYTKRLASVLPSHILTGIQLSIGALLFLPFGVYFLPSNEWNQIQFNGYFGLFYLIIVNSFLSYLLINFALKDLEASQIAVYINLQPIVATFFSFLFGKTDLTYSLLLGGALVLTSIYILNKLQAKERNQKKTPLAS